MVNTLGLREHARQELDHSESERPASHLATPADAQIAYSQGLNALARLPTKRGSFGRNATIR
jgi:hypothetical protein